MTSTNEPVRHHGRCLCGAVRYTVAGAPKWVAHCHCASCRRASGAPLVTWVGFHQERFAVTAGEPASHSTSPGVWWGFCRDCGTLLTYRAERAAGEVHVTSGSLDDPAAFPPQGHVFTEYRIPWLEIADDLPRHKRLSGDDD